MGRPPEGTNNPGSSNTGEATSAAPTANATPIAAPPAVRAVVSSVGTVASLPTATTTQQQQQANNQNLALAVLQQNALRNSQVAAAAALLQNQNAPTLANLGIFNQNQSQNLLGIQMAQAQAQQIGTLGLQGLQGLQNQVNLGSFNLQQGGLAALQSTLLANPALMQGLMPQPQQQQQQQQQQQAQPQIGAIDPSIAMMQFLAIQQMAAMGGAPNPILQQVQLAALQQGVFNSVLNQQQQHQQGGNLVIPQVTLPNGLTLPVTLQAAQQQPEANSSHGIGNTVTAVSVASAPAAGNAAGRGKAQGQDSTCDAASTLMMLQQEQHDPLASREFNFEELIEGAEFTRMDLRGLVAESFFVSIAQMKPCGLTDDDRVGKYKHRKTGFVGMCCKHCGGQPGFGRYFPGSFDSFLNGKNCDGIVKHIATECRHCPEKIREAVVELERREDTVPHRPRYGTRKRFFAYIWEQLQNATVEEGPASLTKDIKVEDGASAEQDQKIGDESNKTEPATLTESERIQNEIDSKIPWQRILDDSTIVLSKDRHLVADSLLVALAQMTACKVTQEDRIGRCKDHRIGFIGMCCRHCQGKAGKPGYGRYFPSSIRSLAQVDSCQHIVKHVTSKCLKCPSDIRQALVHLQEYEKTEPERIRYGSRKMFFRRVWSRLHGEGSADKANHRIPLELESKTENGRKKDEGEDSLPHIMSESDWIRIVTGCTLVSLEDKGLISPAQFAAMAQMRACRLTEADKTGWYKTRNVGFGGFCCRYCGGRPSFGRYFPNSVRSFAQTTSSHTVLNHITQSCRECPEDIRTMILKLEKTEKQNQKLDDIHSSAYGSRKVFYDRVWSRLHGANAKFDDAADLEHTQDATLLETAIDGSNGDTKLPPAESSQTPAPATSLSSSRVDQGGKEPDPKRLKTEPSDDDVQPKMHAV